MKTSVRSVAATLASALLAGSVACTREAPPADRLLDEFEKTSVSWRQLDIANQIVRTGDRRAVRRLESWLDREDRHLRCNAAFVLAGLRDARGLRTIAAMLTDRSARPEGQGIPNADFSVARQIGADRYYAVHLLGELEDRRAVDLLLPLLEDTEINYKVAWALGEIGDERARGPSIAALDDRDAHVRVSAIQALVRLNAIEALPKLRGLLSDHARVPETACPWPTRRVRRLGRSRRANE